MTPRQERAFEVRDAALKLLEHKGYLETIKYYGTYLEYKNNQLR